METQADDGITVGELVRLEHGEFAPRQGPRNWLLPLAEAVEHASQLEGVVQGMSAETRSNILKAIVDGLSGQKPLSEIVGLKYKPD
ncbi:hypothetical protein I1A62_00575 (plasmid) [Rhodococcus sp. USK10]|uniref:hypothetical protein n=1 Tax=Rhodococcus sp. USK10 TaxID=2789739 RepID=UPI001C5DE775|nr:hypothetical protein [Rhodococcus sp. USK10]QYA99653.1 hypothetical protein I1A62_00575 [Rhodococcus sp. USK10]